MDTLPLAPAPPTWLGFNYYFIIPIGNKSPAYFYDASCSREQSKSGAIISCVASVSSVYLHDMVTRRYGNTGPGHQAGGAGGDLGGAPLRLQHSN